MYILTDIIPSLIKIVLVILLSGLIGYERESQDKSAGLRTTIFIGLGATLITIFSFRLILLTKEIGVAFDAIRGIAYYLVAIGFVGGSITHKSGSKLKGLTTSALLLPVSIMGFLCGIGDYILASLVGLIIYLILKLKYVKIKLIKCGVRKTK